MAAIPDYVGDGLAELKETNRPEKTDSIDDGNTSSTPSIRDHKDVEKGAFAADVVETGEQTRDPNIVDWDGPDDPENPMNWSSSKKWANVAILSILTLLTPLASSFFAPAVPSVMRDLHSDNQSLATFVVSVFLLGFAFGPLVIAPLSELHGRVVVYNACSALFLIFTVACALAKDMNSLIVFRFLAGTFGVAPITCGAGTISDMVEAGQRGSVMAVWAMGPLLGPCIGPIAGGFLSEAEGWRWVFWVLAIAVGAVGIAGLFIMRETYAPVLLERKAKRLRKETGNMDLRSKLDTGLRPKDMFIRAIVRPSKLLVLNPICALMSLYMSIVYALLYLLFTTYTFVFEQAYGFSQSTVGLTYLGSGVGMLIGLGVCGALSDRILKQLADKHNGGTFKPEYRLPMLMYVSWTIPVGLFMYGWTAQYQKHWILPILGTAITGIGIIAAFMCIQTYLVDAFTRHAASAMAANTVLRSLFGATFPLFALQLYDEKSGLGLGWGNSLLAFIAVALIPIPMFFYYYGERVRNHPRFQVKL